MKHVFDYIRKHIFLLLIVIPAFFLYMIVIFPSGTFLCFKDACGINFWGVHGHDAIWHMAIANVSFGELPFIAPTFSGQNLSGYNYFLDLLIFLLSKLGIPALVSYFKLLPVVWFVIFTFLLITLGRKIKDSPLFVGLFLFFNYFAGSFSYLLTLYRDKTISGSSTLLPQPAMHMMSNLAYAFSLLPLLVLLILLKQKKFETKSILVSGICLIIIMGLKFYGGAISIFLIFVYLILSFFPHDVKRLLTYLFVISLFIVYSIFLFYDPFNAFKTGSAFGFSPFALVHTITEEPNQFYLQSMTDARYFIMAQGRIGPRLIWIEFLNLMIFLFFYLGTRFFAFFYIGYIILRRKLNKFDLSVFLTIFFSIFLTVTLVQKAEWWNTIQFFFYAIFLLTIYLSMLTYDFIKSRKLILIICSIILLLISIPTSLDLVRHFAVTPGATYLPLDEIKALKFLKDQPNGVVLTALYDKKWKNYEKSNHLYTYEDTAYVAAFSGKQEYFANILQLRLTGVNYEDRLEKLKKMDCDVLSEVNYIYEIRRLTESEKITVRCKSTKIKKIFENKSVIIYSIIK